MAPLEAKSIENLEAAELLFQDRKYCSSVHCAYYSFLQFAKHLLITKDNVDLDSKRKYVINGKELKKGSHVVILEEIEEKIRTVYRYDKRKQNSYNDQSAKLKTLREQSDYLLVIIDQEQSYDAMRRSKALREMLLEVYK